MTTTTLLKLLAGAAVLVLGRGYIASDYMVYRRRAMRLHGRGAGVKRLLYGLVLALLAGGVAVSPFVADPFVRSALVLYVAASAIALVLYRNLNGTHVDRRSFFDDDVIELLWRERTMALAAFRTYRRRIVPAVAPILAVLAVFLWPPAAPVRLGYPLELLPAAVLAGFCAFYRKGMFAFYPSIVTIPLKLFWHIREGDLATHIELADVAIVPAPSTLETIIFVMDESIRGDFLTLGDPAIDTTPYLAGLGPELINYGVALSGHNCSSYSRYLLRYGARIAELPHAVRDGINLPGPNIWQYARRAGFRTIYIDGFSNYRRLHSGMTLEEAAWIDDYLRIGKAPLHQWDRLVAARLLEALRQPGPKFIYVDKYGLHYPYADTFPPGTIVYPRDPDAGVRDELITDYKNGVRWAVDDFFRELVPQIDLSRTALLYTSDHGQSMFEDGATMYHCSNGETITPGEGMVPLFAIVGEGAVRAELSDRAPLFRDRASHFDIFPTLLALFGYRRSDIAARYGIGLFGYPALWGRFLAGIRKGTRWIDAGARFSLAPDGKRPPADVVGYPSLRPIPIDARACSASEDTTG